MLTLCMVKIAKRTSWPQKDIFIQIKENLVLKKQWEQSSGDRQTHHASTHSSLSEHRILLHFATFLQSQSFYNQKFVKDSLYSFLEYPEKYILLSSNLFAMNNMCIKRCHSSLSTLINIIIMTFNILLGWKLKASLANEGVLQKVLYGEAPPHGLTPYPLN